MYLLQKILTFFPFYAWLAFACGGTLIVYLLSLFFKDKKTFLWILTAIFSLSCGLFLSYPTDLKECLSGCFVAFFFACLCAPMLLIKPKSKDNVKATKKSKTVVRPVIDKVKKQTLFAGQVGDDLQEVNLSYAFEVIDRLEKKKLNKRDKMETDIIRNMLSVYARKQTLSLEESHDMNDYLSALLKMMATYSL